MIYTKEMYEEELKTKGYTISYKTNPTCIETVGLRETQEKFELQIKIDKEQDELIPIIIEIAKQYHELSLNKLFMLFAVDIPCMEHSVILKYSTDYDGKICIRCILPDDNGKYPWNDGCDPLYKKQWGSDDDTDYCTITNLVNQFGFRWIKDSEDSGRLLV